MNYKKVTWPSGKARVCKTLTRGFDSRRHLFVIHISLWGQNYYHTYRIIFILNMTFSHVSGFDSRQHLIGFWFSSLDNIICCLRCNSHRVLLLQNSFFYIFDCIICSLNSQHSHCSSNSKLLKISPLICISSLCVPGYKVRVVINCFSICFF